MHSVIVIVRKKSDKTVWQRWGWKKVKQPCLIRSSEKLNEAYQQVNCRLSKRYFPYLLTTVLALQWFVYFYYELISFDPIKDTKIFCLIIFQARYFKEQDIDGTCPFLWNTGSKKNNMVFCCNIDWKKLFFLCFLWFTEFRECFYLFARSGHITTLDELTVIMRSLGLSPTIQELTQYLKKKNGRMSFADFLEVMHQHSRVENLPDEVIQAFKAGDKTGRGTIPARQLRHLLQNWGEGLSFREVSVKLHQEEVLDTLILSQPSSIDFILRLVTSY